MYCFLKDIARIRSGYLFRGKIEPDSNGQYQVIQIGDISTDASLVYGSLTRISLPDVKPSQIVETGDVLFISRGLRKQAVAITERLDSAIATSQIFVLRPDERLLPEYLAWYINQRPAQRYIEEHATGTNVSLINMEALSRMPVQAPSLETQRRIVQIYDLSLREKELMELIRHKRRALTEMSLLEMIDSE
ncbi:MAG: restriction endonuclease subunit S [Acidobacteria bacterium]|nr:restriction endonuclease subunit S [Acidobacteriota bacterium]MCI0665430.1 restriction endonuclease subunit S [Acidobacteriota bacterium]